MKNALKIILPIVAGLTAAVIIILCFTTFSTGGANAVEAATGYQKASMLLDADNMLKYASDYQKSILASGLACDVNQLSEKMKKVYDGRETGYEGKAIEFLLSSETALQAGSSLYEEYLGKYSEKADASSVSAITLVKIKTVIDGINKGTYTIAVVKSGLSWYYGFVTM